MFKAPMFLEAEKHIFEVVIKLNRLSPFFLNMLDGTFACYPRLRNKADHLQLVSCNSADYLSSVNVTLDRMEV